MKTNSTISNGIFSLYSHLYISHLKIKQNKIGQFLSYRVKMRECDKNPCTGDVQSEGCEEVSSLVISSLSSITLECFICDWFAWFRLSLRLDKRHIFPECALANICHEANPNCDFFLKIDPFFTFHYFFYLFIHQILHTLNKSTANSVDDTQNVWIYIVLGRIEFTMKLLARFSSWLSGWNRNVLCLIKFSSTKTARFFWKDCTY